MLSLAVSLDRCSSDLIEEFLFEESFEKTAQPSRDAPGIRPKLATITLMGELLDLL